MNYLWKAVGLEPVAEYKFHPTRKWRADWCFIEQKVIVEQEGGAWIQGRHNRGSGFIKDLSKYNEAAKLGYRVFKFTPKEFKDGLAHRYMQVIAISEGWKEFNVRKNSGI